jgi:hypothetical protein
VVRNSSSSLSKASIGLLFLRWILKTQFISTDSARQLDCGFKPCNTFLGCYACKENRVNAEGIPVSEKDLARFTTGKTKRAAIE